MPTSSSRRRLRRAVTATTVLSVAAALSIGGATAASAAEPLVQIPHSKPGWLPTDRSKIRITTKLSNVSARVYLAPKGGLDALKAAATAVSTPGSSSYGHFLSAKQYAATYGTPASTVKTVRDYLRSQGLKVGAVASANRYLTVTGSPAAVEKAFHTSLGTFQHEGQAVQAPTTALIVPQSVGALITAVSGVDTSPHILAPKKSTPAPPPAGFRNARPCSTYFGQLDAKYKADFRTPLPQFQGQTLTYAPCGYTGPQFRAAYEGSKTKLDGTGVTVAITDAYASPTIASDADRYARNHGDGAYAKGQLTQVQQKSYTNKKLCDPSGWFGEETLDVEAVHAMATGANIRYYASKSCQDDDFLDTLAKVVDDNKARLVSNSWGDAGEAAAAETVNAYETVFLQGALQGISFLFSSGDSGDELQNTGIKSADYPASDPYVTAVGGTADEIGADGSLIGQAGWGTETYSLSSDSTSWTPGGFLYGAGGGSSSLFNKPDYQQGVTDSPYRQVPDVGLDADPQTGMLIGETQTFTTGVKYDEYRIGGTSLASPLFAGLTALSLQQAGKGVGLLNPTIYSNRSAFTDVTAAGDPLGVVRVNYDNGENADAGLSYLVRTFNQDSSLKVTKGYDNVTGVGSPNTAWLTAIK